MDKRIAACRWSVAHQHGYPLPFMGVRTMTEQPSAAATKPVEGELSETELEKVAGGNIGSQSSGTGAGKVNFNPFSGGGTPSLEYWLGQLMF
jgi:hypothetical protein